jgi:hypothetical protein
VPPARSRALPGWKRFVAWSTYRSWGRSVDEAEEPPEPGLRIGTEAQ